MYKLSKSSKKNMRYKYEVLFRADETLTDGWIEHSMQGTNTVYSELSNIMKLNCKPTILQVIEAICSSDISGDSKVFFLEAIACDLSIVAIELRLLEGSK